jgi:hypothetical protein
VNEEAQKAHGALPVGFFFNQWGRAQPAAEDMVLARRVAAGALIDPVSSRRGCTLDKLGKTRKLTYY